MLHRLPDEQDVADVLTFFGLWLRQPAAIGAIMPSGRALALAMAREIDIARPGVVLELGGGTGAITKACLDLGVDPQDMVVLEKEPALCERILSRFPGVRVIRGDARRLEKLVRDHNLGPVKATLSSLPLLTMPAAARRALLRQSFNVMRRDGVFVQYTYGPISPVPQIINRSLDLRVDRSAWVLMNVPPATIWRYTRATARRPIESHTGRFTPQPREPERLAS